MSVCSFPLSMYDYICQHRNKVTNRFYVYVHRRLTDNSIFYIGKGCGGRAWNRVSRNRYWSNIVKKHNYEVEIVFDNLSEVESLNYECDMISGFKNFDVKLSNMTSGGESCTFSPESRMKMSAKRKGVPKSKSHREAIGTANRGRKRLDITLSKNPKSSKTLYEFIKVSTGEKFTGTRLDLCIKYNLNHYLLRGLFLLSRTPRKESQGWALFKEENGTK